ncbi:uncharacterized protein LOC115216772 isoform X2 [Octopus sinensis]|uniref:Uncharacterized protein LOC115216772 isoform X2 n=1 Tax=Octopus sinensis TaxID=2607531 RepID=A0A6P7SV97_9MOLL|nr:uncharacterized protein LOC115216772 isoform X2 [Octopus sinensis]
MDADKDVLRKEPLTSKKMEESSKLKGLSKVKLKVVKKKVHIRQHKNLNRSNSSFNCSLNASTKMKQTLRSNNKALAHALQVARQDLALATNIITSLRLDNRNMMLEAANNKYMASHCLEEQVGARLKPILMLIKQKVSDIGEHLTIVTSAVNDISESIVSYLSTSAVNSRSNSIEIGQNIVKSLTETPNEKVLLNKDAIGDVALKKNVNSQICDELSFIAETFINTDYTSNTLDVLSKVDELESEKLCKNADENHLNVPIEKPKIATKSRPDVERRSSIQFRRESLDEIDFGSNLPTTQKRRRSSLHLSATGLDKKRHQQLDILEPSVIKDSCAEVNLENAADRDKVVKNNSKHIPCTDASMPNGKAAETALIVNDADNGLNNAIPNVTITGEVDMELTEIINNTDVMHESSQNLPTGNDVHPSDINLEKQKDTTVAKETFVKPTVAPNKVKAKGNKKSSKSSKDKKEDERVELESEKLCKNADENHLNVPIEKPKIATKSRPDVERRSSIQFRRESLDEIDFGSNLPTTRKRRRSSLHLSATGLDKKRHQQLDILEPSVIKDSCAEEVNLENAADRDKVVKNNSNHIPCTDASMPNGKAAETALIVNDADNGLNNAIPNVTITGEVDMELTEIINNTDVMHESSQNLPTGNDVHPSDINLEKQKDTTVAKETFVKPTVAPNKVKAKGNKKSSKSSKDKKEDERDKCKETDDNENKTVIELRLPKPGKIVFSATRKKFSGLRPSAPNVRSKKKINEEKKDREEPKSLFDFHDKTPQLLNKKDVKDEGIYNVSLNDSTFGKCQSLGQYRERVAMAKEKKKEEITDVKDNSDKIINDNQTVSRISNECNEEKIKLSQSKKSLTKDQPVARKKSRSRKKIDDDDDEDYESKHISTCETNVPVRTLTRRTRSKVVSYAEVDESFDTSVIKPQATPEINKNCQKTTTRLELVGSDKTDGGMKQSENSKITNKNSLKQDSEMVISSPSQSPKGKTSELSNSNSKSTMNELHKDRAQKHSKPNENLEKGTVSSLKQSSNVSDILERYRKALQDDDVSTNVPLRMRGRSSSHIRRESLTNSTAENARISSSKHRSRSASSVKAGSTNSGTDCCNSDEKMLSELSSTKITKEKRQSRLSKGKLSKLEQEISTKNVRSRSRKSHRNVPEKTDKENFSEKTPDLINADDILKMKKDVHSKVKGKATLICEIKENIDVELTDLPAEATSRNTSPLNFSKNTPKRLSEDNYGDTFSVKRPRRNAIKSISYREPALNLKLRQGDELFVAKALENGNFVYRDEVKKRNVLENVTNVN